MPTSQRHSCLWLWSFGSRSASLLPSPPLAHPLLGKQLPLFLLLEDGNWKRYEKPKFLATCGWRGPNILLCPGPSRSVSPLAPALWPPPPSSGLPLASGQDPQAPCYRNTLQAVLPLNKRGRGPCAVLLGAVGTAGSVSFLLSGLGSDRSPCTLLSILLSVHLYGHSPANPPLVHPHCHPSVHPPIFHLSIHPHIHL